MRREHPKNLVELLESHLEDMAEEPLILWEDDTITYSQVHQRANRVASALRSLGVDQGESVSVFSPNCPEFYYSWFGVLKAGGVFNPVNALFKADEAAYVINHAGSKVLFAHPLLLPVVEQMRGSLTDLKEVVVMGDGPGLTISELMSRGGIAAPNVDVSGDDLAAILYTSGTTGHPKGAMLTHSNCVWNTAAAADSLPVQPGDRLGLILPLFHANAQVTSLVQLYVGGAIAMFPRFSPADFWAWVEKYRPTTFSAVPTILAVLLAAPGAEKFDTSSLRYAICGAAPLSMELANRFESTFGLKIIEGYGLTEGTCVSSLNSYYLPRKIGSIGLPLRGQPMRIVDAEMREVGPGEYGEIVVKGPNVMKGYFKNPEATAETIVDGWLRTGDAGYVDPDGYFFIVDRIKDMIIRGGENIYPREIEEVLYTHPKIAEVAVIPVPDSFWGEEVKAVLTLKTGQNTTEDEIRDFCKERMASYKVPKIVEIRSEPLPKTATGKIQKKLLKEG